MATNYVLTDIDKLIDALKKAKEEYPDRVFVTGIIGGGNISAPTKRCKSYKHKLDILYAPDLFTDNGVTAIMSGGVICIGHLPKDSIRPGLLGKGEQE